VHEEIGKLLLINEQYEESYIHIQQSYRDRCRIYTTQNRVKNASAGHKTDAGHTLDRMQGLITFLNRKIQLHLARQEQQTTRSGIRLLVEK
jgi:hypothetical protein